MKKTATTQKNQLYASEGCQVEPSHTKLLTPFHGIFLIAHFASISSGRPSILISLIENNVKASFPSNCYFFSRQYFYHENTKLVDKKVIVFRWAMLNYSVTAIPIKLQEKDFYESK